jgi:hypothetical protein
LSTLGSVLQDAQEKSKVHYLPQLIFHFVLCTYLYITLKQILSGVICFSSNQSDEENTTLSNRLLVLMKAMEISKLNIKKN